MLLFLALAVLPVRATAEGQEVGKGQRVRITTPAGDRLTGLVGEKTTDALRVELEDDGGSRSVPFADVSRLETGRPRSRSQGAWSKAKWGALIGAVPGAISLGIQHDQVGEDGTSVAGAAALGAWSGGLFGGLLGAVIGALHPGEDWIQVSPRVQPSRSEVSLSITLSF